MKKKQLNIACVVGTRPEAIKMACVIFKLKKRSWANVKIIDTAQHRSLLDDILKVFDLKPDFDLNIMTPDQSLGELTGHLCERLNNLFEKHSFDVILAAGDTTTVFVASLIAFYKKIPFGHVEAGFRTYHPYEPFPEEINRVLVAPLATWHFAPTEVEKENLIRENIAPDKIFVTGNPVIDALYWVLENRPKNNLFHDLKHLVIVTTHRRENFGDNLNEICEAILNLAKQFTELNFIIPIHPNPHVQSILNEKLKNHQRVHLLPPIKYDEFVHLMKRVDFILSDSGGLQEEAPALKKPILVLRNTTERPLIISEGLGFLVGTNKAIIFEKAKELIQNKNLYNFMARGISPYGDGHSAERIVTILENSLCETVSADKL